MHFSQNFRLYAKLHEGPHEGKVLGGVFRMCQMSTFILYVGKGKLFFFHTSVFVKSRKIILTAKGLKLHWLLQVTSLHGYSLMSLNMHILN